MNSPETLREAAEEAGVDGNAVAMLMKSDEGADEIHKAQEMLRDLGVHSIPTFIVQGKYLMNGAMKSSDMTRLFREIERNGEEGEPVFAGILGIPEARVQEGLRMAEAQRAR